MANICTASIKIVGKTEQSIKELISVFNHHHPKFYLYRSCLCYEGEIETEGEYFTAEVDVDVAWRSANLLSPFEEFHIYGKECGLPQDHPAYNAVCTDLPSVCKALDVGLEIWAEESGCCFQEHIVIDHKGNIVENDSVEWCDEHEDEDGNIVEESGGYEEFGDFDDAVRIYHSEIEDDDEEEEMED